MSIDEVQTVSGDNEIPQTEEAADALIADVQTPDGDNRVKDAAPTLQDSWNAKDWTFKVGNKEIVPTNKDQIKNWAQLGYGANHRIAELNKQMDTWKSKEAQLNELHGKYSEIDTHVKQNPQFWQHVMQQWQNRSQVLSDPNNPLAQTVGTLQQQVQELVQYKQTIEQQQQQVRVQQEDQQYTMQMDDIKKAYPQIDFVTPDENGKTKEWHMLQYAIDNGIKNVKTAFRDFFHDDLVTLASEQAKEKVAKDRQKNAKLGILGKSSTPTKAVSSDVSGKSYGDLAEEALRELGIG
jgi:hypothetical protein